MIKPKPWQILPKIFWPFLFVSLALGLSAWALPLFQPDDFTRHFLRNPTVLKTVHLAALGHMALLFLAVAVQAIPVLFHEKSQPLAPSVFGLTAFIVGLLALICFFAGWRSPGVLLIAATGLGLGWSLLFRSARALVKASDTRTFAWQGLGPAFAYLGIMIAFGILMAFGLLEAVLPQDPLASIQLHVHIGLVGFASLAIFGFLPKLLRLFQASTGYAGWPLKAAMRLVHIALTLLLFAWLGWSDPWAARVAGVLLFLAALAFTLQIILLLKAARARRFDSSLVTQLTGLLFLLMAAALDAKLLWGPSDWQAQAACLALGLGGWIGAVLHGTTQRICAVLAWFQRFLAAAESMAVPTAWDLIWPPLAWSVPLLHGGGTLLLATGLWLADPTLIQWGGGLGSAAMAATAALAWLSLRRGKAQPFPDGIHPFKAWVQEQEQEANATKAEKMPAKDF